LLAFLIQSTADIILGEMTDADKIMHPQHFGLEQIRQASGFGSRLIQKSGYPSRITFGSNFGVGGGLHSLSALVIFIDNWCGFFCPVRTKDNSDELWATIDLFWKFCDYSFERFPETLHSSQHIGLRRPSYKRRSTDDWKQYLVGCRRCHI